MTQSSACRHFLANKTSLSFTPTRLACLIAQALGVALASSPAFAQSVQFSPVLQEVTVKETKLGGLQEPYAGGQVARGGSLGVLGTANMMDVPFNTVNFTSRLIEDQQARSVADVVVNDASARALTAAGGFGDEFQIRGFSVSNADTGINGLFGLAPTSRIPLEMVERVEVLKGPGSLANGVGPNGSIGGSINLITKRAADTPLTRLTTSYLSDSQLATHLDVGRRMGQDNQWGVRVNGVMRGGEGTINGGNQKLGLGALGLDYQGSNVRWSMDALAQRDNVREFRPQTGFAAGIARLPAPPDSRLNFYPGTELDSRNNTIATRLEYDINSNLMAYGSVGYTDYSYEQIFPSGRPNALGNFNVTNAYYDYYSKTISAHLGAQFLAFGRRLDRRHFPPWHQHCHQHHQPRIGNHYMERQPYNGESPMGIQPGALALSPSKREKVGKNLLVNDDAADECRQHEHAAQPRQPTSPQDRHVMKLKVETVKEFAAHRLSARYFSACRRVEMRLAKPACAMSLGYAPEGADSAVAFAGQLYVPLHAVWGQQGYFIGDLPRRD
jgi:outer membrane receptor protein involved in Fe transport